MSEENRPAPDWLTRMALAGAVAAAMVFAVHPVSVDDFWMMLAAGRWMWEHGAIPRHDPFSWTTSPTQLWIDFEWLFQWLIYGVYRLAGLNGTILFFAVVGGGTMAVLAAASRRLMSARALPMMLLLALVLFGGRLGGFRPDFFTFLFTAAALLILENARAGRRRWLWLLPLLILVWEQIHGGFALGFFLLGAYAAGGVLQNWIGPQKETPLARGKEQWRDITVVGALCAAVVFLNPYGWRLPWHIFEQMRPSYSRLFITEWQPLYKTDLTNFSVPRCLYFLVVGGGLAGFALNWRRLNWAHALSWVGIFVLSVQSVRFGGLVGILCVPLTVTQWLQWWDDRRSFPRRQRIPFAWPSVAALAVEFVMLAAMFSGYGRWVGAPQARAGFGVDPLFTPVLAIDFLRRQPKPQRLFNASELGNYLMWELPGQKVFIDPRNLVYGDQRIIEYAMTHEGKQGWERAVKRWNFDAILLAPWNAGSALLLKLLARDANWELVYFDPAACVYVRRELAGQWQKGGLTEFNDLRKVAALGDSLRQNFPTLRKDLADTLYNMGALAAAEQIYHRDLELAPDDVAALHGLAMIAADRRDWPAALRWINRELQLEPASTSAFWLRAFVYSEMHRLRDALADIGQVTRRQPHNVRANLFECGLADQAGDLDCAIAALRRVIRDHPIPSPLGYTRLGALLQRKGDIRGAIAAFEKAISMWPKSDTPDQLFGETLPSADGEKIQAYVQQLRLQSGLSP